MAMIFMNLFAFFIFSNVKLSESTFCSEYQECANETPKSAKNMLSCDGYKSCEGSEIALTSTSYNSLPIYCYGSLGCNEIVPKSPVNGVYCYGFGGCYGFSVPDGTISEKLECNGYYSCASDEDVYVGNKLISTGHRALTGANIYVNSDSDEFEGDFYGYQSLYDTEIHSNGASRFKLTFSGYETVVSSIIYCEDGSICSLECNYESCKDTVVLVDRKSRVDISCESQINCIKQILNENEVKSNDISISKDEELLDLDKIIASSDIIDITGDDTLVSSSCKKERACSDDNVGTRRDLVICGGYDTCDSNTFNQHFGSYCTGYLSCYANEDSSDYSSFLACSGYQACDSSSYKNLKYILSTGYMSGENSYLENIQNIDAYGSDLYQYANIETSQGNELNLNGYGFYLFNEANIFVSGTLNADFTGFLSAVKTNIFCYAGAECNISCHKYACYKMIIHTDPESTINLKSEGEENSDYSPTIKTTMALNLKQKVVKRTQAKVIPLL